MPVYPDFERLNVLEGEDLPIRRRLTNHAAATLHSDGGAGEDVSAVTVSVFDRSSATPTTAINATTSLTVATVVTLDTVLLTEGWTKDDTGYNFIHVLDPTDFTVGSYGGDWIGGHVYEVEYQVVTDAATTQGSQSEGDLWVRARVTAGAQLSA